MNLENTVIFTIARMNPPTPGHLFLIENMIDMALKENVNQINIILSSTVDSEKNPIECEEKRRILYNSALNKAKQMLIEEMPENNIQINNINIEIICLNDEETNSITNFYSDEYLENKVEEKVINNTQIEFNERSVPAFELVAHFLKKYPEKVKKAEVAETKQAGKGGMKKIDPIHKAAMRNASTIPGLNMSTGSGGAYMNYRMGIALAGAPTFPTKMEADNWIGGDPLISSYTEEEFEMVKAAALQVGAGTIENWSGKRSEEVADVNKTSAVAKVKKNKYGI
jgi:hypothetical protein